MIRRIGVAVLVCLVAAVAAPAQVNLDGIRALDAQGRTAEALERLEGQLGGGAGDPEAELLRGVLLAKSGRTAEARVAFERLIESHPNRPEAYNNLAVMHAAAGNYDRAIEVLKQGLGTHPAFRTTYDNLSRVYGKLAGEAYRDALGQEIDSEPLRLALISSTAEPPAAAAEAPPRPAASPAPAEPAAPPVAQPPAPPAGPTQPPPAVPPTPAEPTPAAPAPPATDAAQQIWQTVEAWADAWRAQDVEQYLSFYAPEYAPAGATAAGWRAERRRRLSSPRFIEISLALLEVTPRGDGAATVRFVQEYESDRFSDVVTKRLDLEDRAGQWRIVGETVEENRQ